ncbi:PAS domain-containing protein [Tepidicaulis sp. LMO-SS28]|uniref:PAS domain-containing protein n=1 Tax=Tepidicaulis sp. LMO-SS28 TaxID=3447455 RepID=UPI003EE06A38
MRWFRLGQASLEQDNHGSEGAAYTRLAEPQHPQIALLLDYWEEKRGPARRMPARSDIKPTDIPSLMPYLILFDVLNEGEDGYIRVFGSELSELIGEDRTGMRLSEIECQRTDQPARNIRSRWLTSFQLSVYEKVPAFMKAPMNNVGRDFMIIHAAGFPLSGDTGEEPKQVLSIMTALAKDADDLLPPPHLFA